MGSYSLSVLLVVGVLALCAQAHMSIWTPSMFGQETNPTSAWLAQPLQNYNYADWWMHGTKTIQDPPKPGQISTLPAGGHIDFEITGNKWCTSMQNGLCQTNSGNPRVAPNPWDNGWGGTCSANVHAPARNDVAGCALAIAYKNDINAVNPEDFVVFSVVHDCIARQLQSFDIPALPACPNGGCICSWFWIHNSIGGTDQMYMTPFKCQVSNPSNRKIGKPSPPIRCDGQPTCYLYPKWGNITNGCKNVLQPMYWANEGRQNMFNPTNAQCAPMYNSAYGFNDGAQNNIFVNGYQEIQGSLGDALFSNGVKTIQSGSTILVSSSYQSTLTVTEDGNVVFANMETGNVIWASNTAGNGVAPYSLTLQENGNLELIDGTNTVLWETNTANAQGGYAPYRLKLYDPEELLLVDANGSPLWAVNAKI